MKIQVSQVNRVSVGNLDEEFALEAATRKHILSFCLPLLVQAFLCQKLSKLSPDNIEK